MNRGSEGRYRAAEARFWTAEGVSPVVEVHALAGCGVGVRMQVVGAGPPVVLLHGVNTAGAVWAPLVAHLGEFRCIAVDRPGCGLSEPLPDPIDDVPTFDAFADRLVVDLLDALDIERAHLVSTSLGGYHAHRAAAAHPDRVASLTQLGWSVGAPNGRLPLVMRIGGVRPLGRLMARMPAPESAVKPMLARIGLRQAVEAGRVSAELVAWFHALLRHTDTMRNELDGSPPIIDLRRGMNEAILLPDELLARIEAPVHYLWGDGDPFGGTVVARAFAAKVPGSDLTVLPGAGHAPWIDDPAAVAGAIASFLRAHPIG